MVEKIMYEGGYLVGKTKRTSLFKTVDVNM